MVELSIDITLSDNLINNIDTLVLTIVDVKEALKVIRTHPHSKDYVMYVSNKVIIESIVHKFPYIDNCSKTADTIRTYCIDDIPFDDYQRLTTVLHTAATTIYRKVVPIYGELYMYDSEVVGWMNKHTVIIGVILNHG